MTHLKIFVLVISFFSFFKQLFGQRPTEESILTADVQQVTSFEDAQKHAEKVLLFLLENKTIPGVSVSFTHKGHTLWEQGYGWADVKQRIPIIPSKTIFRIASVSKSFSGVGLAKMHEQGYLNWHNSLYDYVPSFPRKAFDFSIKQLAGHLAGIRAYKGREVFSDRPLTIEQGIEMFANDPLLFPPGTKYHYNSFDWNLISLAMQNASKIPFETYMHENIFVPLGMKTTFPDMGGMVPDQAIPYTKGKQDFYPSSAVNNFYKLAGGGFLSTSQDVARLGNAILSGQFFPTELQGEMLQSMCLDTGEETGYGVGWQSSKDWNNRWYYGHIGNGIGGYAWFYVYPETQSVMVMCFNVTNPSMNPYLQKVIDYILEGIKYVSIESMAYITQDDIEKNISEFQQKKHSETAKNQ